MTSNVCALQAKKSKNSSTISIRARWKTRGRGPGVRVRGPGVWKKRGVENAGSGGKHGVSVENTGSKWKTRGLSAKHEEPTFSPNNEVESLVFQIAMKINRRETRFMVIS